MGHESGALKHSHLNVEELKFAAYFFALAGGLECHPSFGLLCIVG